MIPNELAEQVRAEVKILKEGQDKFLQTYKRLCALRRIGVAEGEGDRDRLPPRPQGDHSGHGAGRHGEQASASSLFLGGQAGDGAVAGVGTLAVRGQRSEISGQKKNH